ncbi:MAG: PTO1314 family radical SAM protein [Smithella sp.]|jgi:MoaA/NifB/PqqE/SkfB family radical SAM enzyme
MSLPLLANKRNVLLERPLESIAIALTMRCNLRCKMCGVWGSHIKDIPYEKVLSLLDNAYELGARRFDPFGTELFVRNDTPDILTYADRIGFREIYVVSNGLLLNRPQLLDILETIKSLVIVVSIDGSEAIHDELRGNGVYQKAVSSLRELTRRGIKTSIASIIMRPTLDHMNKIIDLAADLNIPVISMQPYSRDTAGPGCDHAMFEFKPDEKKIIAKKIKNILKYARQNNVIIYTENMLKFVAPYLAEGVNPFPTKGCQVPSKTLVVDIEGNTNPCFVIKTNMGNINETNLSSIWHSDIRKEFVTSALAKKCSGCLRACSMWMVIIARE